MWYYRSLVYILIEIVHACICSSFCCSFKWLNACACVHAVCAMCTSNSIYYTTLYYNHIYFCIHLFISVLLIESHYTLNQQWVKSIDKWFERHEVIWFLIFAHGFMSSILIGQLFECGWRVGVCLYYALIYEWIISQRQIIIRSYKKIR